jgi:hypothetical protein
MNLHRKSIQNRRKNRIAGNLSPQVKKSRNTTTSPSSGVDVVMDFGKSKSNWIFSFWTSLDWITLDVDVHMLN